MSSPGCEKQKAEIRGEQKSWGPSTWAKLRVGPRLARGAQAHTASPTFHSSPGASKATLKSDRKEVLRDDPPAELSGHKTPIMCSPSLRNSPIRELSGDFSCIYMLLTWWTDPRSTQKLGENLRL